MRLLLLAGALCSVAALSSEPTPAALRRAFENNRDSLVRVTGPKRSGLGVMVGASGHVLTSVRHVGLQEAQVEWEGAQHPAQVLVADAYQGIALVKISSQGPFRAAPVRLEDTVKRGQTVVAVRMTPQGPAPVVAVVRRRLPQRPGEFELERPVQEGSPIFDAGGKLLGVAISGRRVVPVAAVKQKLAANAG